MAKARAPTEGKPVTPDIPFQVWRALRPKDRTILRAISPGEVLTPKEWAGRLTCGLDSDFYERIQQFAKKGIIGTEGRGRGHFLLQSPPRQSLDAAQ